VSVVIGASKEHVSLHANHPLVLAAIDDARQGAWSGRARVLLGSDAPSALAAHSGKAGRLRLLKVGFDGFEPMDRLVPVLVLESGEVLDAELGEAVLGATLEAEDAGMGDATEDTSAPWASEEVLADATEEALFTLQTRLDGTESTRFTQALQQAERFVDDQRFVWRRRQLGARERLKEAELRRDGATGSEARTAAERAVVSAQVKLDEIDEAIERLERREDERLRQFEAHIHARRGTPPHVERLFDLDLVIT
jgi:hypothetical protein